MKVYQNVRGSQKQVPQVEVNKDTVYIRSNIERIEEDDFTGWEYDEVQYPIQQYIEKLTNEEDLSAVAMLLSITLSEVDMLKSMIGGM